MPRSNGSPEEAPAAALLLPDHTRTSLLKKTGGFRLTSFSGIPQDRFGLDDTRLLRKSRTISSHSSTDSVTPVFPGPLLPTVRRLLNTSPISSSSSSFSDDPDPASEDLVEAHCALIDHPSATLQSCDNHDGFTPDPTHNPECNYSVPASDATNSTYVFSSTMAAQQLGSDRWSPRIAFSATESAQIAKSTWRPKSRTDNDRIDRFQTRPLNLKTLKRGVSSQKRLAVETSLNAQSPAKVAQTCPEATGNEILKLDNRIEPPIGALPIKTAEQKLKDNHDGGQQFNSRRRRISGSSLDLPETFEGRDDWLNEIRRAPPAHSRGNATISTNLKSSSSKSTFPIGWLGRNRSNCHQICIILLLVLCTLVLFYALAMNDQVMFLEKEVSILQEKLNHCTGIDDLRRTSSRDAGRGSDGSERADLKISSDSDNWKVTLLSIACILVSPFICFRYIDEIARLCRRSASGNNIEEEVPLSKRIAYSVDVLFSTYGYAKSAALLLATILLICVGGVALSAVSGDTLSDALWLSWTYVADSGNHADSVGTGPRIVSVCISFGGMLIFALMLGLVSDAISEKVDSLRKGKSEVIESNHTLILGWSDKLGSLLKQLAIANQSLGGSVVVVLAERDKEEMELDIAKLEFDFMGTSVICRSGSPLIMADLKKVSVSKARAIIVLAEVENADQSDARALRVVLSLTGVKEGLRGHVVVELSDLDNEPIVKLVGGELVETVVAHDVIGRLMIQCARQPGLAQIWEDILGFENAEFYIKRWPQLDGICFEDVLLSFPDAIPCGLKVAAQGGKIVLNPDDDYILCDGDEVLVIAEDDDTYAPSSLPQVRRASLPKVLNPPKLPEKILFCGWRRDIDDMIQVLEAFLAPGSELWIFSEVQEREREKKLLDGGLDPARLDNIILVHREGNPVIRRHLESLPLETFDSILILADEALEDSVVTADSRSLATLLLIRDIQSKRLPLKAGKVAQVRQPGYSQSSWIREMQQASDRSIIISEILDSRTKNLVAVSKISDYVLSNELVSMALAMVAEDKQINRVLEELFAEEGNELYIRPAEFYLDDQEELTFFEIMHRARQRQEIIIGYRQVSSERFIINPPDKGVLRKWALGDVFIALAQEE